MRSGCLSRAIVLGRTLVKKELAAHYRPAERRVNDSEGGHEELLCAPFSNLYESTQIRLDRIS